MGRTPYISRREGRYVFRARLPISFFQQSPAQSVRISLRTSDYPVAKRRTARILTWFLPMTVNIDLESAFRGLIPKLFELSVLPVTSEEQLVEHRAFNKTLFRVQLMLRNRRVDPEQIAPRFEENYATFTRELARATAEFEAAQSPQGQLEARRRLLAKAGATPPPSVAVQSPPAIAFFPPRPRVLPEIDPQFDGTLECLAPSDAAKETPCSEEFAETDSTSAGISQSAVSPTLAGDPPPSAARAEAGPAPAAAHSTSSSRSSPVAELPAGRRVSDVLRMFLDYRKTEDGDRRADNDVAPIVRFAIALWGDPMMAEISPEQIIALKTALPDIPTIRGFSQEERQDLFFRYNYAKENAWRRVRGESVVRLKRPTVSTLKGRYKLGLEAFFAWAIPLGLAKGPTPNFAIKTKKNPGKRKRDAFSNGELISLFLMPLFTGCDGATRICSSGSYFFQNAFYWAILISLFAGLRPGETAQLRCRDIQFLYGKPHFRFARFSEAEDEDAEEADRTGGNQAKSDNALRWVPIFPLLIRLGLLERRKQIMDAYILRAVAAKGGRGRLSDAEYEGIEIAAEEEWLFPDWKVYVRGSGVIQWSQAISKSWQYVKTKLGLKRGGVTFYSARHSFKGFIDDIRGLSLRSSRVLMGHSTEDNVPNSYGPKTITESQMEILLTLSSESINQISAILISAKERAERGELKIIDAWRIDRRAKDAALQAALAEREEWYRT